MSALDYCICIEELARVDPSVSLSVAAHNGLGAAHIAMFGSEAQKQAFLTPLANGDKLAAWRSEEHTSELQSRQYLVCRLLLEKKHSSNRIPTNSARYSSKRRTVPSAQRLYLYIANPLHYCSRSSPYKHHSASRLDPWRLTLDV